MGDSIRFNHADSGETSVDNGTTALSDALVIGAINLTSKRNVETHQLEYATDSQGLEIIAEKSDLAANFLTNSVRSIGVLLANVDAKEIEYEINSISWLIVGLSELALTMDAAKSDIEHAIKEVGNE